MVVFQLSTREVVRLVISDLISFPMNVGKNLTHHLVLSLTIQGTIKRKEHTEPMVVALFFLQCA
jgi:hypothetical protein